MKKKIIDLPKIKKEIRKKHKVLMDKIGNTAEMISADHEVLIAGITSKIIAILNIFVEEKIIDKYEQSTVASYSCYSGFHITKKAFRKSVDIWTDGIDILIRDSSFAIKYGAISPTLEVYKVDGLNDEEFANRLCDYIHSTIYGSMEALEAKIFRK